MFKRPIKREDYGIVLDFLPQGYPLGRDRKPVAQILGEKYFTLLEVAPKAGVTLKHGERVYIGPDKRERIHHVIGRINISKLTNFAREELENAITRLVEQREKEFVDFFNNASGINIRLHEFEVLPGIGKKHMWHLLEARKEKPFESFEDIQKRVPLIPDPKKIIVRRIIMELEGKDKYKIFTA